MLKNIAIHIYNNWAHQSDDAFLSLLQKNTNASLLDLGCGDGKYTKIAAKKIGTKNIAAIEGLKLKIKGIKIKNSNLNNTFPFPSECFDVVLSNYSIEHLYNTPLFVSETYRVLKKEGYAVVATDNLSSVANIISLILGFQAFSTAFFIHGRTIGNPFAVRSGGVLTDGVAPDPNFSKDWRDIGEFGHNKVLAYRGLLDSYKAFGFEIEKIIGVGYLPFTGILSKFFSLLDPKHAHLLIIRVRKM